jgi:cytochrome c-type biogenesis protein CcmH/NrfG
MSDNDPERMKRAWYEAQRDLDQDERQKNLYKQAIIEAGVEEQARREKEWRLQEKRRKDQEFSDRIATVLWSAVGVMTCFLLCVGLVALIRLTGTH